VNGHHLHVKIDEQICQGTGYCARVAPLVFEAGDPVGRVLNRHPDDDQMALVEEAATLCPIRAITY
jgi:ferredoxin